MLLFLLCAITVPVESPKQDKSICGFWCFTGLTTLAFGGALYGFKSLQIGKGTLNKVVESTADELRQPIGASGYASSTLSRANSADSLLSANYLSGSNSAKVADAVSVESVNQTPDVKSLISKFNGKS